MSGAGAHQEADLAWEAVLACRTPMAVAEGPCPLGRLLWVSAGYADLVGVSAAELQGAPCGMLHDLPADPGGLTLTPLPCSKGRPVRVVHQHRHPELLTRTRVLARTSAALGQAGGVGELLSRVTDALVPLLADVAMIDLLDDGEADAPAGVWRRAAVSHRDPDKLPALWRMGEPGHPADAAVPAVPAGGGPLLVPVLDGQHQDAQDQDADDAGPGPAAPSGLVDGARRLGLRSLAVLPLLARGRVIGMLTLASTSPARLVGPEEVTLAEELATRAALAVDNARLLAQQTALRQRADALTRAGLQLTGTLRRFDVSEILLKVAVPELADWAVLHLDPALFPEAGRRGAGSEEPSGRRPDEEPELVMDGVRHADSALGDALAVVAAGWTVRASALGPGAALATGQPQLLAEVGDRELALLAPHPATRAGLAEAGLCSLVAVPLVARSRTLGVLTLIRTGGLPFTTADAHFAADLARAGGPALDNARLYQTQRTLAGQLQRALLPTELAPVPGLQVAVRYQASTAGAEVGGDWYDLIPLSGGRTGVAVGDVMGHGTAAAAVMGQLRAALRSYAIEDLSPELVLARLSDFAQSLGGEDLATCLYGVYDPEARTLALSSAGHLPPLLLHEGVSQFLGVDPGLPLGVVPAPARPGHWSTTVTELSPCSTVLLFTDGLVEGRSTPVGEGLERLELGLQATQVTTAAQACDLALAVAGREAPGAEDDVAVLALRTLPGEQDADPGPAGQLEAVRTARIELGDGLASVRRARHWLVQTMEGWRLEAGSDVAALVATELVTNAIRHGEGARHLELSLQEDLLRLSVSDRSPRSPRHAVPDRPGTGLSEGGRGLVLIEALSAGWGYQPCAGGKQVWCELRVVARPQLPDRG